MDSKLGTTSADIKGGVHHVDVADIHYRFIRNLQDCAQCSTILRAST